jgi:phosphoribosyl 1,2-cyclic phosphodiesterase
MKLKIINSNSEGNCYLLQADLTRETLIIDCGVHVMQIKKALNFDLRNVNAIVTHSHQDHSRSIKELMSAGVNVYTSFETHVAKGTENSHRAKFLKPGIVEQIGSFKIKPFAVNHDVPCLGFLISHPESGLILFLTDTFYCDYTFAGLNNIIIEANHDQGIIKAAGVPKFLNDRIIQSHMNIQTCKDLLAANDLTQVNNIVLIHLSDLNSDARFFKRTVTEQTGKNVFVAEPGLCIDFNKEAI